MSSLAFKEIKPEMALTVLAENRDLKVELPLKLCKLTDEERKELNRRVKFTYLALDVVLHEWKEKLLVVSFQDSKAKLSLLVLDQTSVYRFEPVGITSIELKDGKRVHLLVSKASVGKKFNRRHGIRIGMNAEMLVFQDDHRFSIYVNDVSYCGIGLLEDNDQELLDVNKTIIVRLVDPNTSRLIGNIPAKIVRRNDLGNGRSITGCMIETKYHAIMQKYIANRQMERVKRYASHDGVKKFEDGKNWKSSVAYQFNNDLRRLEVQRDKEQQGEEH